MAETEEGLWMTTKERDRLKVLHEVKNDTSHKKQAAAERRPTYGVRGERTVANWCDGTPVNTVGWKTLWSA